MSASTATPTPTQTKGGSVLMKEVVKLTIRKEDVGPFVGKGGSKIKNFVIEKTRSQDSIDGTGLYVQIITKGEEAYARLKAADSTAMDALKENLMTHQDHCEKTRKFRGQTRFVFKTKMEKKKKGKFIGRGGENIQKLKDSIVRDDKNLSSDGGDKVFIQIKDDEQITMRGLKFGILESDVETSDQVLIIVSIYTDDRDASWETVSGLVKEAVDLINTPEEEDTWGGKGCQTEFGADDDVMAMMNDW